MMPPDLPNTKYSPGNPDVRLIQSDQGKHLFVVDGSRFYDLPDDWAIAPGDDEQLNQLLTQVSTAPAKIDRADIPAPPPVNAISLNLAQTCNMGCGYCYADEGRFGGQARSMSWAAAKPVIDRLFAESRPGGRVLLGFMGGEPLLQRKLLHQATEYASEQAALHQCEVGFSITTNLTLLQKEDAELFREYPFTVTVSLDGPPAVNNLLRPMRGNGDASSYDKVMQGLQLIKQTGRPQVLSARTTVTPRSGDLLHNLQHLIGLGFDDVGFTPVMDSPVPELAFDATELDDFLAQMIACGEYTKAAILADQDFPFSNLHSALHEIHRGTHRPYPCGAGAAYLSANAEGKLYACHRLIDDEAFAMGDASQIDQDKRQNLLAQRHVDQQEPCKSCWARYLCGGGCYHEVEHLGGRTGCHYIRGWLDFCLSAYAEVSGQKPAYFSTSGYAGRAIQG